MGYKVLGYVVWRGGRWYVRRRYEGASRKLLAGGLIAMLICGAVIAQRQNGSS